MRKTQKKIRIRYVIYVLFIIFAPPVLPYTHLFLSFFSIIFLINSTRSSEVESVLTKSFIIYWTLIMVFTLGFALTIPSISSMIEDDIQSVEHYLHLINRYVVLFLSIIPPCVVVCIVIKRKYLSFDYIVKVAIYAGLVESAFSILSYAFPPIKQLFVQLMKMNTGNYLYSNYWFLTVRSFGFASTLVDLFGLGVSIIASLSLFYGILENKWKYVIYSVIIIIPALLNARTGVILYAVGIMMAVLYLIITGRLGKVLIISVIGCIAFSIGVYILSKNQATYDWIKDAFTSVTYLVTNGSVKKNSSLNLLLTSTSWDLPEMHRIFLGTGHSLYGAENTHSDIGYINEIWLWGILGCVIVYGSLIYISGFIIKNSKHAVFKMEALFILVAYFIFNFKAAAIGYNPGATAMFIMLFTMYFYTNLENEKSSILKITLNNI